MKRKVDIIDISDNESLINQQETSVNDNVILEKEDLQRLSDTPPLTYLEQIDAILSSVLTDEIHLFNDLELLIIGTYSSFSGNFFECFYILFF